MIKKIFDSNIQAVLYKHKTDGYIPRRIFRSGDFVYNVGNSRLDNAWKIRMQSILSLYMPSAFIDFTTGGYITKYIDGPDLQGNYPFEMDNLKIKPLYLTDKQLGHIKYIFQSCIFIGKSLGYTFGDVTCGNIFLDIQGIPRHIDYEVITSYPLSQSYKDVWQNTYNLLGINDIGY